MTNLARLFFATTLVSVLAVIALGLALINEGARSSEYSQQSYRNGHRDGELEVVGKIIRADCKRDLIEESKAHIAEEKL